ncbi:MAG: transporter substrate-binding domain-containing protein [Motiliproteus sp.]
MHLRFKSIIPVLLLLLVLCTSVNADITIKLSAEERDFIQSHPTIKIANAMDWPPFDFNEFGQPDGLVIDHFRLVAARAGLQLEFVNNLSWTQLLDAFKRGEIDAMPVLYRTTEREQYTLFTRPYYETKIAVFARPDDNRIRNLNDLRGMKVGVIASSSTIPLIRDALPGGIILVEKPGAIDLVKLLNNTTLDAIVDTPLLFNYYTKSFGINNFRVVDHISMTPEERSDHSMHIGIRKDYPLLQSILDKAAASISAKEFKIIERRWIHMSDNTKPADIMLSNQERAYLNSKGRLNLCIDPNWLPYEAFSDDGKLVGMTAGHFKLFSERLGVTFKPVVLRTWSESLEAMKTRRCDVLAMANKTDDRSQYMIFTSPYVSFPYVVATKDSRLFIDDFSAELDKTYSVVRDYAAVDYLRRTYPTIKLIEVDNISAGLELVRTDKVFGYIGSTATLAYTIRTEKLSGLKVAAKLASGYSLRSGVRSDEPLLRSIMQKAIDTLSVSERDRIYNRWVKTTIETPMMSPLIWSILAGALLVIITVVLWNRKLHSERHRMQQDNVHLQQLSSTDALTKVFNRSGFEVSLLHEIDRAEHDNATFSIIMMDIDYFKQVNDTHGHQTGDQVLIEVAEILSQNIRHNDILCRWGGEEFIILSPDSHLSGSLIMAENLRQLIANGKFDSEIQQTASFGISLYQRGDTSESIVKRVDQALYQAKETGRNRVEVV